MAQTDTADARSRPFTQVRLYGDLADMVEERSVAENKSRATLVDELLRAAWAIPTDRTPAPIAPPDPPRFVRARVFSPRPFPRPRP